MIYVNLFVQSNGVVAYSKLLCPLNECNGENERLQEGRGRKSMFNMESDAFRGRVSWTG